MYFRFAFLLSLFIMEKFGQNDSRLDMAKTFIMAFPVMEFQDQGYKIGTIFAKNECVQRKF